MKKFYSIAIILTSLAMAVPAKAATGDELTYTGLISVEMQGSTIGNEIESTVLLTETAPETYTFTLQGFNLDPNGNPATAFTDIIVENVTRTDSNADGTLEVTGSASEIVFTGGELGEIHASVDINGTEETADGNVNLTIDVEWIVGPGLPNIPINVTFTGRNENAGIANNTIAADWNAYGTNGSVMINGCEGIAEIYGIDGRLLKTVQISESTVIPMNSGLYIVRTVKGSTKVIVY